MLFTGYKVNNIHDLICEKKNKKNFLSNTKKLQTFPLDGNV